MTTPSPVSEAVTEWSRALDASRVLTDDRTLDRYARTTQERATRPACVVYPESTEEVRAVVEIAGRHGVVLYPISRGRNWGYGDACAPTDGAAVVDLSRMNRIIEVNAELGYAVIEAGVTQQQLHEHLQAHAPGLWMDSTGAGPGASLVGNTLDRGFGHTRYGDHFLTCCGMEVVLADGRVLDTGFGHYAGARAARVYRYGVGPFLDGLFCQSNLGIITRIGLWLMPRPESFSFFFCTVERDEDLVALVDALRPFRLSGLLTSAVHIGNDLRVLSSRLHYPWDETGGATPLPEELRRRMRRERGIGMWSAAGALTGTREQVAGLRRRLRRALRPLGKVVFVNDAKLAMGERVARILSRFGWNVLSEQLASLRPVYNQLKGFPVSEPLHGAQWRLRKPPEHPPTEVDSTDPLEVGAGLMWISPVVPLRGGDAMRVMRIVEPIFTRHGFETPATFTMINERSMVGILNVFFDKSCPEEATAAAACYNEAMEALIREGYIPYRTGLRGMDKLRPEGDVFWQVASDLKRALDPDDIIARGRYIPPVEAGD